MLLKVLIISVILVALTLLGLGIRLLFSHDAEFPSHSCALENGVTEDDGSCSACQLKDLVDCPQKKGNQGTTQMQSEI